MYLLKLYFRFLTVLFAIISFSHSEIYGQGSGLEEGFKNPPGSAMPRTWWHWTNSNVTKEGITKDLEWMKRVGIGGMMLADVASGQGQAVEKKIYFGSPEWLDAVHHAASEADRLGLEMTIFSSAGWSLTGGPWVKPDQAMKKLVWSETSVTGPAEFNGKLSSPPSVEGPIRNLSRSARVPDSDPGFYKDCIVLAFPSKPEEDAIKDITPVVTTGAGRIDPSALIDEDLNTTVRIRSGNDKKLVWIQYDFGKPVTVRAVTLANRAGIPVGTMSAINDQDGEHGFKTILVLPGAQLYRTGKVATYSFPETTSRYFRFEFTGAPLKPAEVMAETVTLPDSAYVFNEIKFHSGARVNRWEDKAGFYHLFNYEPVSSPEITVANSINPEQVINVTEYLAPDGIFHWKVPPGEWTIMRLGYSLTGSKNRPAIPAGTGYEVDKLSKEHTLSYIRSYTEPILMELGPLYGKSLQGVMLDSWEAGMQNWTDNMLQEFKTRRGYDLSPFLPCLTGYVVGNGDISDRVLWDFRRTLADMFAENHYAVLTDYLNKQGIKTYGEASGVSLEILEDALLCKKYVDYPMGEFWYRALHPELMYYQDIRGAASASHVYGKTIVAAESFTGGGFESPYTLKKIGDYWFTQGVNRFVFHTSAHQPLDSKPGNTMVGTHINRNITWAEQAGPFMTYLARNSFMLQQGRPVADIAYLLDEGAPSTMPIWGTGINPEPPEGYDYDYINADVLVNRLSVESGRLILPGGVSYAVLVLPQTEHMTMPVLNKIEELVRNGATVTGSRPAGTPGFSGYPGSERQFGEIAKKLWGDLDGISRTRRSYGKGMIVWGLPLEEVLLVKKNEPDFIYEKPLGSEINWIHRQTGNAEIYFIVNSSDESKDLKLSFRIKGKEPEAWDPAEGSIKPSSYEITGERTIIPASLGPRQSEFIVFRKPAASTRKVFPAESLSETFVPVGAWDIAFGLNLGAPEHITVDTLKSWTLSKDEGVKFFSGPARYSKTFQIPRKFLQENARYVLDLGKVGDLASVSFNGKGFGLVWKAPFETDITGFLQKGANIIAIEVINQWTNRLAGDRMTRGTKVLSSNLFVRPGYLPESGLMGPVVIKKYIETKE
ncbi:MAG TPA: glycosyl hydrolase, partial [Bacteroidales bacterium]|nr:glycosyl hydrolase [Bacteroidales bacterium]